MAGLATPSATAISTMDAKPAKAPFTKPEKPDEEQYKTELAKAEKELNASNERMKAIKAKLDIGKPNNKDSPTAKRQQELRAELQTIRTQQQSNKSSRGQVLDKIKRLDEQLKSRQNEQKNARSKINFKSADDVQREIDRLQGQVDTGLMKLVDEKKALADISMLKKTKKGFSSFEQADKGIADVKTQIAELRKSLDDPEGKALSDRYTAIGQELDQIKAEQDEVYKNLNSLYDQRRAAHEEQQQKWQTVKDIKDRYFQALRVNKEYEREAYKVRQERKKADQQAYEQGKRRQVADAKLEEASAPAYQDEIITAQGLIRYFDPSSAAAKETSGPGKFAATATRTVDDSGIKGTRLPSKKDEEESYFMGTGGKKGKKGRKGQNAAASPAPTPSEGKFNLSIGVIEELAKVGVEPPMNQGDVPSVVEKLKEKLEHWKSDQDRKTKESIAKAQKEIDRLEAEAEANGTSSTSTTKDAASKPAQALDSVNGDASAGAELAQEDDAVAGAASELEKAKIEDAES
ncbi:multicopy suppressor of BFA (Brefeldin A) [Elasticomyces elasticus]|nr:multicopy suppressor of BFA (Brefeldin A) [Elasticomyces elasticus]